MTTLTLRAAAREQARSHKNGQFGRQDHAESGVINPCPIGTPTRRAGEPVMKVLSDGTRIWTVDGELDRRDGPAVVYQDGSEEWYRDGLRHCDTGPAKSVPESPGEYWLDGVEITRSQFAWHQATRAAQSATK